MIRGMASLSPKSVAFMCGTSADHIICEGIAITRSVVSMATSSASGAEWDTQVCLLLSIAIG